MASIATRADPPGGGTIARQVWRAAIESKESAPTPSAASRFPRVQRRLLSLGGSRHSILRVPVEGRRTFGSHHGFGRSVKVYNFASSVGLFLVAGRTPKVEDLGFSLRRFCPFARPLQAAYDGRNGNGRLAMQAYDSAESWAFRFNRHFQASLGFGTDVGRHPILPQSVHLGPVAQLQRLWKYREQTINRREPSSTH